MKKITATSDENPILLFDRWIQGLSGGDGEFRRQTAPRSTISLKAFDRGRNSILLGKIDR